MEYSDNRKTAREGTSLNFFQPFSDTRLSSSFLCENGSFFVSSQVTLDKSVVFTISGKLHRTRPLSAHVTIDDECIVSETCDTKDCGNVNVCLKTPIDTLAKQASEGVCVNIELDGEYFGLLTVSKYLLISFYENVVRANSMMPSRGFFGNVRHTPLRVDINEKISSLTLRNDNTNCYLNFTSLKIYSKDGHLLGPKDIKGVTASSTVSKSDVTTMIASHKSFHSTREDCPSLTITFHEPVLIGYLELTNRRDKWGSRIQNLTVLAELSSQEIVPIYNMQSSYNVERDLMIIDQACYQAKIKSRAEGIKGDSIRKELLSVFLKDLESNIEKLQDKHFNMPIQMLSMWNEKYKPSDIDTHKIELSILALFVFYKSRKSLTLSLNSFSRLLPTSRDIEQLEENINYYRKLSSEQPIKLTKHGAAKQGMLVSNVDAVLTALNEVMLDLSTLGYNPCLAYGTLLGAKREGQFIAHDDDVDILIELSKEELNEKNVKTLMEKLQSELDSSKYRINIGSKTTTTYNIHVFHKQTNIMIDIFPYWFNKEHAYLHMEKMKIRSIPRHILTGRDDIELYGKPYPAPINTSEFLEERYGDGWETPDRYHEWPWPVSVD